MSKEKKYLVICFKFIILIAILLLQSIIYTMIDKKLNNVGLSYILTYSIIILLIYLFNKKNLNEQFKRIKDIKKKNLINVIIVYLIFIALMYISNYIIYLYTNNISTNEELIRNIIYSSPILMGISSIIFAPICEELTFRYLFFNNNTNKYFMLFFTSFLFALLHIASGDSIINVLFTVPYLFMGLAFGYAIFKTNNIYLSIFFHIVHNFFTFVLLFM